MLLDFNILRVGKNCTGCGACVKVCPYSAIRLLPDKEGFEYPSVSDACVGCGACLKVCHTLLSRPMNNPLESYMAITRIRKYYKGSASGGIFTTFAHYFLASYRHSHVCGAAYVDGMVKHVMISSPQQIGILQNSKYVQSSSESVYPEIKQAVKKGEYVLFCGTPCQVQGLYAYLRERPVELVTLDIVCHGVPSPHFFKVDIDAYKLKGLKNVSFRWKSILFKKSSFFLVLESENKKQILSSNADPYFKLFMSNKSFRECCYTCLYANLFRMGDITIGDCHVSRLYPDFHPNQATSTVLITTNKGRLIWNQIQHLFDFRKLDLKEEAKINEQLSYPSTRPKERDLIYQDLENMSSQAFRQKYGRFDLMAKGFVLRIIDMLPIRF